MAKASPYQRVQDEHGSKEKLADKVLGILERPEEEDAADFERRVHTMSNKKLLRLWDAHETVQQSFGSREELVDRIVTARFPGGNVDYRNKLLTFSLPKLLDLARQHGLAAR